MLNNDGEDLHPSNQYQKTRKWRHRREKYTCPNTVFSPITTAFRHVTMKRIASAIEIAEIKISIANVGRAEVMPIKKVET